MHYFNLDLANSYDPKKMSYFEEFRINFFYRIGSRSSSYSLELPSVPRAAYPYVRKKRAFFELEMAYCSYYYCISSGLEYFGCRLCFVTCLSRIHRSMQGTLGRRKGSLHGFTFVKMKTLIMDTVVN